MSHKKSKRGAVYAGDEYAEMICGKLTHIS